MIAEKRSVAFASRRRWAMCGRVMGMFRRRGAHLVGAGSSGGIVGSGGIHGHAWSARKWTMESLPIDPKSWRWRLSGAKGAVQRYRSLVELLRSDKVTELVNACDPDREGEAIFRRILMAAKISKPSLRLWVASLDEQAIRDAWKRMRPESDYDGLSAAADARGEGRLAGRYERVTRPYARLASQSVARTRAHTNVEHGRPT